MNYIEQMVAELCPRGVEFKTLGEVAEIKRGTPITKDAVTPGQIPVIAGGRTPAYYHDTHNRTGQTIVIAGSGAYAGYVSWWEQPVFVSDAFSIRPHSVLEPKYCFYWLNSRQQQLHELKSGGGVPHVYPRDVAPLRIPLPPLPIQQEIVRVLDLFMALLANLQAELVARRKQYQYYRDQLLSFEGRKDVRWGTLGEIGNFIRGSGIQKSDFTDSGSGCIHYGQIHTHYGTWAKEVISFINPEFAARLRKAQAGDLVIATTSEDDKAVAKAVAWLGDEAVAVSTDAYIFRHTINPKYVSYFFQTELFQSQKKPHITGTKVRRISGESLSKIRIPIPSLEVQEEIVTILDKFDALVNDLCIGLPAEIAARQKQYEYYRDRLLTFPEAG
ncbi:MAG: restriction endonuclease subunit S [Candidatus Kapabacteria bacterium]|nr:restriction endonuclease subunit S [Candidatus Kapabacteria bacterium]